MSFDWTLPARTERYVFERLNPNLERVGALMGVRSCSLDWSIHNRVRASGDLSVRTLRPIEWAQTIVRPWAVVSNRTGRTVVPLMTGLCEVPDEDWTDKGVEVNVQLHSRELLLDQSLLEDAYVLQEGTVITTALAAIFTALGVTQVSITPSTRTLSETKTWLPSETESVSWLRVINDLLDLLGYFALWTDAMGWFQCQPYIAPGDRVPSWRIADDGRSNRYVGLKIKRGLPITYNRWVYWSKAADDTEPIKFETVNDDPQHPFSTVNLRRTITDRRVDVEGDVAALVIRARAEGMADQRSYDIGARYLPVLEHEVVELVNDLAEVNARASVSGRSLECVPGARLALTLRDLS